MIPQGELVESVTVSTLAVASLMAVPHRDTLRFAERSAGPPLERAVSIAWARTPPPSVGDGRPGKIRKFFGGPTTRCRVLDLPVQAPFRRGSETPIAVEKWTDFPDAPAEKLVPSKLRPDRIQQSASTTFCVDSAHHNDILGPALFGSDSQDAGIEGFFGRQDVSEKPRDRGDRRGRDQSWQVKIRKPHPEVELCPREHGDFPIHL
jgi:hypothetical protein